MKTFYVARPEVHLQWIKVKAENETDALQKVHEDEGDYYGELVYSHMDDNDFNKWRVTTNEKEAG